MAEFDLSERFPEMQPIRRVPPLSTVHGIGLSMCGTRDRDAETGTFVKTLCFTLLFVPFLALRAYRVANAPTGGWYFLGRVPLSTFAKAWNVGLVIGLLALGGRIYWHIHTGTPEYAAAQKLSRADELAKAGQYGKAAELCREVAEGKTAQASVARDKLKGFLDEAAAQGPGAEAAAVFRIAADLQPRLLPDNELFERGTQAADRHADSDPRGAAALLDAITPVAANPEPLLAKKRVLWEHVVQSDANDADAAVQLALVYEAQNDLAKCEPLLAPFADRLGTTEGARILGHIYTQQSKLDEAHALLQPYLERNLTKLHDAERQYESAQRSANDRVLAELNKGPVPDFPVQRYQQAGKAEQQTIVQEYLHERTKDDQAIRAAQKALIHELAVVPVAIDYGIVLLRRAQGMRDEALRRAELEKAKQTFLAIRGVAGHDDAYRIFLGQVHYWLGEHAEGRKLFDEQLQSRQRSSEALIGIAKVMREVGAVSEARALVEEAYAKENAPEKKYAAAGLRAVMRIDLDDEIKWLRLANPSDLDIRASLNTSLGQKAHNEGKDEEARDRLKEAIEIYAKMSPNAAVLNNGALAHFSLFAVTGDRAELEKATQMFDQAIALQPQDSILLGNAARSTLSASLRDIVGSEIDLNVLKKSGDLDLVGFLFHDQAGRKRYVDLMRKHPGMVKARAYEERLLVLAPRNVATYGLLFYLDALARDEESMRRLLQRTQSADLDLSDTNRDVREQYAGKDQDKRRTEQTARLTRLEGVLKTARKTKKGPTLAVAAADVARIKMSLAVLGAGVKADEIVALAEEAHAAAPSAATQAVLVNALFHRAHGALMKQETTYAALANRARRSLDFRYLIAVAVTRDPKARAAALANKDVQRGLALEKETFALFPDAPDEWVYAMLRAAGDKAAEDMGKAIQTDLEHVQRELQLKLSPLSAGVAFDLYWACQAAGQEAKGIEILKQCAARGVPMPFDP